MEPVVLVTVWGRRGAALGQVRQQPLPDYATGLQRLQQVSVRRRQRGYRQVFGEAPN
jgi:predicted DNA-binding WGR domain protein